MDEITVDMDVVGRADLLEFFKQECETRGATIIYATHIFDGLEAWISHVAYLEDGKLLRSGPRCGGWRAWGQDGECYASRCAVRVFNPRRPRLLQFLG